MSEFLANPFIAPKTENPNFPGLGNKFLLAKDAKRYEDLLGKEEIQNDQDKKNSSISTDLDVALKNEEMEKLKKTNEIREISKQIIAWAEKYNLGDKVWVEKNFEFNNDGSVICNTSLYLDSMIEPDFPKSIKRVNGVLSIDGLASAKGLNLPDIVSVSLFLNCLTSAKGLNLPKEIGGDIFLGSLISAEGLNLTGIEVGGYIFLHKVPDGEKNKLSKKYPDLNIV